MPQAGQFGCMVYLVANQVLSRGLTFVLNALVVRAVDPSAYGVASVRLNLVLVAAVSLVRDTLRQVGARLADERQLALNLAWLAPALVALLMAALQLADRLGGPAGQPASPARAGYGLALALYCAASVVEASAEPAYVSVQARMLWRLRALVEGAAHLARCLVTYGLLRARGPAHALFAFAAAQLAHAAVFAAGYWLGALWRGEALAPRQIRAAPARAATSAGSGRVGPARLLRAYGGQQLAKFALTHGEALLLLACVPDAEQGAYAVVMNLGSLLARFVLEPAEETAFAQLAPHARAAAERLAAQVADAARPPAGPRPARGDEPRDAEAEQRAAALDAAAELLARVCRRLLLLGLLFGAFGPAYARLLLHVAYGARWSDGPAPALLGSYCLHVPAMALNGVLEAAVRALATAEQLGAFNRFLAACALCYWLALLGLLRAGLGLHGVVLANALNLGARAAHHVHLLSALFAPRHGGAGAHAAEPWARRLLPTRSQAAMLAMAAAAVGASALRARGAATGLRGAAEHVLIGALNFGAVGCALLRAEGGADELLARLPLPRALRRAVGARADDAGRVPARTDDGGLAAILNGAKDMKCE